MSHAATMGALKDQVLSALDFLRGKRIVYVDFPVHFNTGDLLINLGTEAAFAALGVDVAARFSYTQVGRYDRRADRFSFKAHVGILDRLIAQGCILIIHGGGNFGDIWLHHQRFREALVARYKGAPTVIMPQSVHFQDPAKQALAAGLLRDHGAITMFARDEESFFFARDECGVAAAKLPDMAHCLWRTPPYIWPIAAPGKGELLFARDDIEGRGDFNGQSGQVDWGDLITPADHRSHRLYRLREELAFTSGLALSSWRQWYAARDRVVDRSITFFAGFGSVRTDRLHAVILSALIERPVTFADNSYGKLGRYRTAWLSGSELVRPLDA